MTIHFSHPEYLLLLPLVWAFTWWVLRGSLADLGRARARGAGLLRGALLTILVLALAGIQFVRPTANLCTVFAVDISESIAESQRKVVLDYINNAMKGRKTGDRAALVAFGADAILDYAPDDPNGRITDIRAIPVRTRTDISAAIQMAMATFPQESGKQIVIFTDGNENLGNAVEQAGLAHASDVRISVVRLERDISQGEALLLRAESPAQAKQGAPFQVNVLAEASKPVSGTITLYRNNSPVDKKTVKLPAGKTVVAFEQSVPSSGLYNYKAILDVPARQDSVPDNNIAFAYTRVEGRPKVLVVEGTSGDGVHLANALRANDLLVERGGPERIPTSLAECAQYESITFANVPAWQVTPAQMAIIRNAVRDTGMGFTMVGGEHSFGAGGYFKTPIEDTLPVSMEVKKEQILPAVTLVIVIDISGSMTMDEGGVPKIRLAAEAAASAVELLRPQDQVCVIGFDTGAVYTVKMTRIGDNKQSIINQVNRLEAGGGGILIYPAMKEAYNVIKNEKTPNKHVIMCPDAADTEVFSESDRQGAFAVARQMKADNITLSMIGFGHRGDPHVSLQKDIARHGNGRHYLAERLSNLPRIFSMDVLMATKPLLIEEPFRVRVNDTAHPVSHNIPWDSAPPLQGYVATSMKETPTARQLLATKEKDPLLAAWPFGLGRSVAFTSDATGHWAAGWLGWGSYPSFWAQAQRWTLRQGGTASFQTTIVEENGRATVVVDAVTGEGEFRNMLDLRAHVSHVNSAPNAGGPQATSEVLSLNQTAPGHYEASFEARQIGTYVITVEERGKNGAAAMQTVTMSIPYSPEFQAVRPNSALLSQITQQDPQRMNPAPADIFGRLRFGSKILRDIWPSLLLLLTIFFLLDVAVRRLLLPWDELFVLAGNAIARKLPRPQRHTPGERRHTATMGTLLSTKANTRKGGREMTVPTVTPTTPTRQEQAVNDARMLPPDPAPTPAVEPEQPAPPASTAGRLLQKKRERGK